MKERAKMNRDIKWRKWKNRVRRGGRREIGEGLPFDEAALINTVRLDKLIC